MVEVFALQIYFSATQVFGHALRKIEERRPSRIFPEIDGKFVVELFVPFCPYIGLFQFVEGVRECLRSILPAKFAKPSFFSCFHLSSQFPHLFPYGGCAHKGLSYEDRADLCCFELLHMGPGSYATFTHNHCM